MLQALCMTSFKRFLQGDAPDHGVAVL